MPASSGWRISNPDTRALAGGACSPPSAGDEVGVDEARLAIAKRLARDEAHASARRGEHGMAGGGIPFHGAPKARIEVGDPLRQAAELEGAAGGDPLGHPLAREKALHDIVLIVGAARQH